MKKVNSVFVVFLVWGLLNLNAQRFEETIKEEIEIASGETELVVKNVTGSITIEGYSGSSILFEVNKEITASSTEDLELGKKELLLKIFKEGNRVIAHPDAPYINFSEEGMGFNWCNNNGRISYEHKLDFKIKVPKSVSINASTVNDGEVLISNISGESLKVSNVNGGIELNNVTGTTDLNCVNGDVKITYTKNPSAASKYYALNGDMNISYQSGLSANVSFKSMNGELFTDFDINDQFTQTKKSMSKNKAKFKFEAKPVLQIGQGDVVLDFETLNGNVYIKKI